MSVTGVDELVHIFDSVLKSILDKHAPLIWRSVRLRPNTEWYNDDIRRAKSLRRKYERLWCKSGLHIHKELFNSQRKLVNELMTSAKKEYFSTLIHNCGTDQRKLFGVVNQLLSRDKQLDLPNHISMQSLCDDFGNFFKQKIDKIQSAFTHVYVSELGNNLDGSDVNHSTSFDV